MPVTVVTLENMVVLGNRSLSFTGDPSTIAAMPSNGIVIGNNSMANIDDSDTFENFIVIGNDIDKTDVASDSIIIGDSTQTNIVIGGVDFSGGPGGDGRVLLSSNVDFYVSTTGNDSDNANRNQNA